ncbi:hypothetical protein O0L34_g5065 [Tuta absoluta]|nr:hypothetical protein O0L34_g5065 [Tuta absoluta]
MEKSNRKVQYLAALSVSMAALTMGVSSGWPSPVLPKFAANETSIYVSEDEIGWMLSFGPPGFVVGSLVTGLLMDRVGRRATFLLSALPYSLGMIMVVSAVRSWMLFLTLFLWNVGSGMLASVMTLYFGEISDKEIRGTLSLVTRIAFNFGFLMMMCVGPFLAYDLLNQLLLVMPLVYLVVCWWIPESPYHYLKDGRVENARKVLRKLRGYKEEKALDDELQQMRSHVNNEMRRASSPVELFSGPQYRKAVTIAAGLKMTAIMTGGQTITQYLGIIMQESAIKLDKKHALVIFGIIRFFISIMPSILVDKVGRRPLLIYSYIGTGISLAIVGVYFFCLEVLLIDIVHLSPYGFVTLTGIISANVISTMGFNSLVQMIPGEIFPLNVKASAFACLGVFAGVLGFIIAKSYQGLKDCIGLCGVFWIFAVVAICGAVFSIFCVPETKGKSLEEIQIQLQGKLYNDGHIKLNGVGNGVVVEELQELNMKQNC